MRTLHARAATSHVVALALLAFAGARTLAGQQPASAASRDALAAKLLAIRETSDSAAIPPIERFTFGDTTVGAGRHATGPVAVANGTLHVRGIIDGNAVAYGGDIVVHQGGEIRGDALAILGKVLLDGGVVDGETRTLAGNMNRLIAAGAAPVSHTTATMHALALAAGWLAVLVVIGIGVLLFASTNLDATSDALEHGFSRAFIAGIATQLALAPALALICVGLCLTILGVLLVPFAVVAYILAAAGLVTLGYLAIARMLGRAVLAGSAADEGARRTAALRSLLYGLLIMMVPWFISGAFAWSPRFELLARMIAVAITWVAATAGLGAAVVSRGGVRRAAAPALQRAMNTASWATPTPVSGVTAARRPTPLSTSSPK